jgi:hypothetical protein
MKSLMLIAACIVFTGCQHIGPGSYSAMYPPGSPCLHCGQSMLDQYQPMGDRVVKRERQWNDPR